MRGRTVCGTGLLALLRVALLVLQGHSLMGRIGCGTGMLGLVRVSLVVASGPYFHG